jgi:Zn-dependent peptidase ImmA (M78 family)/O-acetyl-ADP-ribose deacetylase (regulator of RNase III)
MTTYWTNESVLRFAGDRDPVDAVEAAAQELVLEAVEHEWQGPPFDPFELARIRGIPVVPMQELSDARTVPAGGKVRIEYNPTRPPQRLRFSLAHEIAHTIFPDVAEAARYRNHPEHGPPDAWQLELLCNIAAGEILMPTASLPELREGELNIERLMALRREYGVSTEALLRRATKLSVKPVAMFAASRTDPQRAASPFRIDYAVPSRAWQPTLHAGQRRPADSVLAECTAVGFTARRREHWSRTLENVEVEAVGAPPFPEQRYPRVLGLLRPHGVRAVTETALTVLHGDATEPRGPGLKLIVHLVNDKTPNWGGAFARALRDRWPDAQDDFRAWVEADPRSLTLGAVHIGHTAAEIDIATMIAQHGYGPSASPRVRYGALKECLDVVAEYARANGASVHMPRIGAGQAGGRWPIIRELIEEALTRHGISVTVYVPPNQTIEEEPAELTLGI